MAGVKMAHNTCRKAVAQTSTKFITPNPMRINLLGQCACNGTMDKLHSTPARLPHTILRAAASDPAATEPEYGFEYTGSVVGSGLKFGIVIGRFNDLVTKLLLEGAIEHFERHGVERDDIDVAWVPGSFELPLIAKSMAKSGKYDAVVAIGVVVRGATTHYDAVVSGATSGVLNASVDSGVPVVFGVLTCDTMEQALDRAGGKVGNKGGEAAVTAIEMANLLMELRSEGKAANPW